MESSSSNKIPPSTPLSGLHKEVKAKPKKETGPFISAADVERQRESPPHAPIEVQPFDENTSILLEEDLKALHAAEKELEKEVETAEALHTLPDVSLEKMLSYDPISNKITLTDEALEGAATALDYLKKPPNVFDDLVLSPTGILADLFDAPDNFLDPLDAANDVIGKVKTVVDLFALPFQGFELIARGCFLNQAQKDLKELAKEKQPSSKQQKIITDLKLFILEQKEKITSLAQDLGITTFSYIPQAVISTFKIFKTIPPRVLTPIFSAVGPVLALISSGISLHKEHKASALLKKWEDNPAFKERGSKMPIDELLEKRKALFLERRENRRDAFEEKMQEIESGAEKLEEMGIYDPMQIEEEILVKLRDGHMNGKEAKRHREEKATEKGNEVISSPLIELIKKEDFKAILLDQYAEYEETISVTTRNGIKTLAEAKPKVEKKFFTFKLNKERILFVMTALVAASSIVLEVLVWGSIISMPFFLQAIPGLGIALAGIVLLAVGLYLFYRYKPSLFKTTLQGVELQLSFFRIPLAIQNYRMARKKIKQGLETAKGSYIQASLVEVQGLLNQKEALSNSGTLPPTLVPILEDLKSSVQKKVNDAKTLEEKLQIMNETLLKEYQKYLDKRDSLNEEIEKLEKKVESLEKRTAALSDRLRNAAAYDFAKNMRLETGGGMMEMDLYKIIADGIIDDDWSFDPETKEILEKRMGISLEELTENEQDTENLRTELQNELKEYFGMDKSELENFIKRQNFHFNFA